MYVSARSPSASAFRVLSQPSGCAALPALAPAPSASPSNLFLLLLLAIVRQPFPAACIVDLNA